MPPALRRMAAAARRLDPWLPPLALMAVIFWFSHQPNLSSGLGVIDLIGRKVIHALEYGLLAFLSWRALCTTRLGVRRALPAAFAVAVAYAISDEWHQSFVEGRVGSPIDVAIDTAGAALALLAVRARLLAPERR